MILMRAGLLPAQAELPVLLDDSGPSVSAPVSASTTPTGFSPSIPFDLATIRRYCSLCSWPSSLGPWRFLSDCWTLISPCPEQVSQTNEIALLLKRDRMRRRSSSIASDDAGPGIPSNWSRPIGSLSRPSAVMRMVNLVPRGRNSCS